MADGAPHLIETDGPASIALDAPLGGESAVSTDGRLEEGAILYHVQRYKVLRLVGEGGFGRIYRAYDPVLARDVALKALKPDVPEQARRRFHQEAMYGARFHHPGVVRVYDLGVAAGGRVEWFAMEYLPGRDLEDILERVRSRGGDIPMRLLADVFRQALGALQYSHDCNVVHRDVKPANLFVTRDPNTRFVTTKLLDFGVALNLENDGPESYVCGDPRYMAPEQAIVGSPVDHRADIYAAGMSMYEVFAGHHPFQEYLDGTIDDLLGAHAHVVPKPISYHLLSRTPRAVACGLDVVFAKACAKDPDDRFDSAHDMYRALWDTLRDFLA